MLSVGLSCLAGYMRAQVSVLLAAYRVSEQWHFAFDVTETRISRAW